MNTNKFFKWAGLFFCVTTTIELVLYLLGKFTPSNVGIGAYMFVTALSFLELFMDYKKK